MPVTVVYHWTEPPEGSGTSEIQDLSPGGLRFLSRHAFKAGSTLGFVLSLPAAAPVAVKGRIIWSQRDTSGPEETEYGVEFLDPSAEFLRAVAALAKPPARSMPARREERRQWPRVALHVPIEYRTCELLSNAWHSGLMQNASLAGVRLVSDQLLDLGWTVEIRVRTPGRSSPYLLRGIVVTQRIEAATATYEHGIQFEELTGQERQDLEALLQFISLNRSQDRREHPRLEA